MVKWLTWNLKSWNCGSQLGVIIIIDKHRDWRTGREIDTYFWRPRWLNVWKFRMQNPNSESVAGAIYSRVSSVSMWSRAVREWSGRSSGNCLFAAWNGFSIRKELGGKLEVSRLSLGQGVGSEFDLLLLILNLNYLCELHILSIPA